MGLRVQALNFAFGAVLTLGSANSGLVVERAHGQELDPSAVVQQFFDAVNRGDAAGAAAVVSETGAYTGFWACQHACSDVIQMEISSSWMTTTPWTAVIEPACGNTVAVRTQDNTLAGTDNYGVVVFPVSKGRISAYQRPPMGSLPSSEASARVAKACVSFVASPPAALSGGGRALVETRMRSFLGATALALVATVLIAVVLNVGRRLRTKA